MDQLFRRVRGIVGTGLTWGAAFGAFFGVLAFVVSIVDPASIDPGEAPLQFAKLGAMAGIISGATFGLLFSFGEARRKLLELSPARAAIWGAMGSATIPLLSSNLSQVIVFCPVGAAVAAATVAIARRAEQSALPGAADGRLALGDCALPDDLRSRSSVRSGFRDREND